MGLIHSLQDIGRVLYEACHALRPPRHTTFRSSAPNGLRLSTPTVPYTGWQNMASYIYLIDLGISSSPYTGWQISLHGLANVPTQDGKSPYTAWQTSLHRMADS